MLDIRQILYTLKQEYGHPVSLYQRTTDTPNLQTGALTIVEKVHRVRRAIVLPVNVFIKYFKHAGDAKFEYSGDLTIERRIFIIDKKDLFNVPLTNAFFIIFNYVRYSIELFNQFDYKQCFVITGKEVNGTDLNNQICVSIQDWIYLSDEVIKC